MQPIDTTRSPKKIIEEVLNSLTHGLGAIAATLGLIFGLMSINGPSSYKIAFLIYAACLILLMTMSSLSHALVFSRAHKVFKILDESAIFLLIAGSFTPFVVTLFQGTSRAILLVIIWTMAGIGITTSAALPRLMVRAGMLFYLAFGWLGIIFIPKLHLIAAPVLWLLLSGGLLYTVGVLFYRSRKPFMHVGWHVLVLVASCLQYFAVIKLV
jgi:hemolysin III